MSKAFTKEDTARRAGDPAQAGPAARGESGLRHRARAWPAARRAGRAGDGAGPGRESDDEAQRARGPALGARITELQGRLRSAVEVNPRAQPPDEVRFGATVTVREPGGAEHRFQIVGVDEAGGRERIAFVAPLARALLGRRVGERAAAQTPRGEEELEVVAIGYDDRASRAGGGAGRACRRRGGTRPRARPGCRRGSLAAPKPNAAATRAYSCPSVVPVIARLSVFSPTETPAARRAGSGWHRELRVDADLDVRAGADLEVHAAVAQLGQERRLLGRAHAVADARGAQARQGLAHAGGAERLAGVGRAGEARLTRERERGDVVVEREAGLVGGEDRARRRPSPPRRPARRAARCAGSAPR